MVEDPSESESIFDVNADEVEETVESLSSYKFLNILSNNHNRRRMSCGRSWQVFG